jgi:hypothetical protein
MTGPGPDAAPPARAAEAIPAEALEWTFNPWRERPGLATLAGVLALGMCAILVTLGESTLVTAALAIAAIASLSPALAPARCRVDAQGAARGGPFGWQRRPWSDVRRAVARPAALVLSPYASRHWLDPYRALFLPLPALERDRLLTQLRPVLAHHGL